MTRNYYEDLEISNNSSAEDISQAYRRLALRYHPKFKAMDEETTMHHFSLISEAYQVLSDPMRRAFYDEYGEEQLKQGFFHKGELAGGYRFNKNPLEIFELFFLKHNPFAEVADLSGEHSHGTMFGCQFQAQNYELTHPPKAVDLEIECSLEELYNGCSKIAQYYRRILNQDGRTTRSIVTEKMIQIKRGTSEGARILFPKEGDQAPRFDNSDLIVTIREVKHSRFTRAGDDLIYVERVELADSWTCPGVKIVTLDSRVLRIPIDEVISPTTTKIVEGEGMPVQFTSLKGLRNQDLLKSYKTKGNLIIKFEVVFPESLTLDDIKRLEDIFNQTANKQA